MNSTEKDNFYNLAKSQNKNNVLYSMQYNPVTGRNEYIYFPDDELKRKQYADWVAKYIQGNFGVYDNQIPLSEKNRISLNPMNNSSMDLVNYEGKDRPDQYSINRQLAKDAKDITVKKAEEIINEKRIREITKAKQNAWLESEIARLSDGGAQSYTEGSSFKNLPPRNTPNLSPELINKEFKYKPSFLNQKIPYSEKAFGTLGALGALYQMSRQYQAGTGQLGNSYWDREYGESDPLALRPLYDAILRQGSFVNTTNNPEWVQRNPLAATVYGAAQGGNQYSRAFADAYVPAFVSNPDVLKFK